MPGLFVSSDLNMHPGLKIVVLIGVAIVIQFVHGWNLLAIGGLMVTVALLNFSSLFLRMLIRSRWLMLTLILIYALTTPGEFVRGWPDVIAPSYEGIRYGLEQGGRLTIMLAGLAMLLGSTRREALMAGIYVILLPTRLLGGSPERFAARMWLTLHYVEQRPYTIRHMDHARWALQEAHDVAETEEKIVMQIPAFNCWDGLLVFLLTVGVIGWLR